MKKLLAVITVVALALVLVPGAFAQAYVKNGGRFGLGDFESTTVERQFHLKADSTATFMFENTSVPAKMNFKLANNGAFGMNFIDDPGGTIFKLRPSTSDPVLTIKGNIEADAFNLSSSRTYKTGFAPLSSDEILNKVAGLEISRWQFKADPQARQHIGPMAEDFYAAFGVGSGDKSISLGDASGVALAAIQGLHQEAQQKDQLIADLVSRIEKLEQRLAD